MTKHALVIGANGGIAKALINEITESGDTFIHAVSRSNIDLQADEGRKDYILNSSNEDEIKNFVQMLKEDGIKLNTVICTSGVLHREGERALKPEKKLEDIQASQLSEYFLVNSIIPALWLKHLVGVMDKTESVICCFSARVGSISENQLGGWYGYRASKAALNMLMKTAAIEYARRSKKTILCCYHPGTVDTGLSKPFQANVKPEKLFSPQFTAQQLLSHMQTFLPEESPYYIDWDNKSIAY